MLTYVDCFVPCSLYLLIYLHWMPSMNLEDKYRTPVSFSYITLDLIIANSSVHVHPCFSFLDDNHRPTSDSLLKYDAFMFIAHNYVYIIISGSAIYTIYIDSSFVLSLYETLGKCSLKCFMHVCMEISLTLPLPISHLCENYLPLPISHLCEIHMCTCINCNVDISLHARLEIANQNVQ